MNHRRQVTLFVLCSLIANQMFFVPQVAKAGVVNSLPAGSTSLMGTFTIWQGYQVGGAEETAFKTIVQRAMTNNPGLTITIVHHDFSSLFSDYEAAVRAGGGPDMFIAPNDALGNEARAGLILNLDSYLVGKLTNVNQMAIDSMKVNGHLYGVPESSKAVALYYNKSKISTPPPTTGALLTLLQSGKKLAAAGQGGAYFYYGFWGAFGGQLMDASGRCIATRAVLPGLCSICSISRPPEHT